jgi:hypothetical protein
MTIKPYTSPDLSMSEIQSEFGGSNPIGLNEYYAGGPFVNSGTLGYPRPSGSPVAIPSSGEISLNNFYGASAEPNAVTLANYFWNNRSSLVRYSDNHAPYNDSYPGDLWTRNSPNARFVGSFTNSWSFSNGSLPITSAFYTAISVATGAIGNYGGITSVSTSPGTLIVDPALSTFIGNGAQPTLVGDGFGVSAKVQVFQGQINSVTSHTISSTHRGSNNGAWTHVYLIPGKWGFTSAQVNFSAGYAPTLTAGDMHMIIMERGGDYSNPIPRPAGINNMTVDQFWYNGAGVQMSVNTSSSPVSLSWSQMQAQYDNYGNYIGDAFYSYFDTYAITPRVGAILRRFY